MAILSPLTRKYTPDQAGEAWRDTNLAHSVLGNTCSRLDFLRWAFL